jgi:aquaporin Z
MNARALAAEGIGTFALVFVGCGTAMVLGPASPVTIMTTAFAFGLTALSSEFALGHISGGHFNPAVTIGLIAGGRFQVTEAFPYIVAQCLGAAVAAALLVITLSGAPIGPAIPKFSDMAAIASRFGGKGEFSILTAFVAESISAALLVIVIMGSTAKRASAGFAPIAIGLSIAFLHFLTLPLAGGSFNPARATATAVFAGGKAFADLWLFWAAPVIGAAIGGAFSRWIQAE